MSRYKPVGWRKDSYRHYLAAKYGSAGGRKYFVERYSDNDPEFDRVMGFVEKTRRDSQDVKEAIRQMADDINDPKVPVAEKVELSRDLEKLNDQSSAWERDARMWERIARSRGYMSPRRYYGVYVYRHSLDGKHRGDETDNERRSMYGMEPLPGGKNLRMSEAQQQKYAFDVLEADIRAPERDIEEIRVTDDGDMMLARWKDGRWRFSEDEEKPEFEKGLTKRS